MIWGQRAFVVTQSLKKIKGYIKKRALNPSRWHLRGKPELINLNDANQIARDEEIVDKPAIANKKEVTDPKRFIKSNYYTDDGEVTNNEILYLDNKVIDNEAKYNGLYAVCTNYIRIKNEYGKSKNHFLCLKVN